MTNGIDIKFCPNCGSNVLRSHGSQAEFVCGSHIVDEHLKSSLMCRQWSKLSTVVPLERQVELWDAHADEMWPRVFEYLSDSHERDVILALARQRLIDNFPNYGDSLFRKNTTAVTLEARQEGADLLVYLFRLLFGGEL